MQSPSVWQRPGTAVPWQLPVWQTSFAVKATPSSQELPSARTVSHRPDSGLQAVQELAQTTDSLPVQLPPWQVSVFVQASLSSHAVPSGFAGPEHSPVEGL